MRGARSAGDFCVGLEQNTDPMPELKIRATQRSVCVVHSNDARRTRKTTVSGEQASAKTILRQISTSKSAQQINIGHIEAGANTVSVEWARFLPRSELPHVTETVLICPDAQSVFALAVTQEGVE